MTESELDEARTQLVRGAAQLGIQLTREQVARFQSYCSRLLEANQRFNLTALKTPGEVMRTLFLDSLTIVPVLPAELAHVNRTTHVADVGTGAGAPGLPLEILFPHWSLLLVESNQKKAGFVRDMAAELGLTNVSVESGRAEDIGRMGAYRDSADLCLARAVASLPALVELCAPLVKRGGLLAFPKSGDEQAELNAAAAAVTALRLGEPAVHSVPEEMGLGVNRYIVVYRKKGTTPADYPRRVGVPTSRPIGSAPAALPPPIRGRRSPSGSKQRRLSDSE